MSHLHTHFWHGVGTDDQAIANIQLTLQQQIDEGSDPKAFVPVADIWARGLQLSLIGAVAYGLMRETLSDITQPINLLEKPIAVLKNFADRHEIIGHALVAACHPSMNHVQSEHDKEFHMATTVALALAPLWQDIINNTPTNSTEWSGLGLIGEKIVQEFSTRLRNEDKKENTPPMRQAKLISW